MAQALILVNGVVGSNGNLPLNTLVQLNNQNVGGELTYNWLILDQPKGTADALSSLVIQNPTFTPRKEGTYLIQLTVNVGLPTEVTNTVICGIEQVKTGQRIPAAGETTQDNTAEGWAVALNSYLQAIDKQLADPGIIVGVDTAGGLSTGSIVNASSVATIKSGLPGQEIVPGFTLASASTASTFNGMVALVESDISQTNFGPFSAGTLIRVRFVGMHLAGILPGATLGQIVYLSNVGSMSLTQGTNRRQVGTVMQVINGTLADVWFDGVGGFEITPISSPYLTNGPASTLTGSTDVTNLTATLGFDQKTGSGSVDILDLNLLAGSGANALVVKQGGTTIATLSAAGLSFLADATVFEWPDWQLDVTGSGATAILNFLNPGAASAGIQFAPGQIVINSVTDSTSRINTPATTTAANKSLIWRSQGANPGTGASVSRLYVSGLGEMWLTYNAKWTDGSPGHWNSDDTANASFAFALISEQNAETLGLFVYGACIFAEGATAGTWATSAWSVKTVLNNDQDQMQIDNIVAGGLSSSTSQLDLQNAVGLAGRVVYPKNNGDSTETIDKATSIFALKNLSGTALANVTLPSGSGVTAGRILVFKDEGNNSSSIDINPPGGGQIDGSGSSVVFPNGAGKALVMYTSDTGSHWWTISFT